MSTVSEEYIQASALRSLSVDIKIICHIKKQEKERLVRNYYRYSTIVTIKPRVLT